MIIETPRMQRRDTGDDNVIPLINIVFLMLIFFMVAGQVAKSDAVRTDPPESINDTRLGDLDSLAILVTGEGAVYIADRPVEKRDIRSAIERILPEYKDPDTLSVRIKVDADLPVTELRSVLREVRAAGLVRVSLITRYAESAS